MLEFDVTDELVNTQVAPVVALAAYYQAQNVLEPLETVTFMRKKGEYTPSEKLTQVLLSILVGCEYISMVNTKLVPERKFAQLYRKKHFASQATLARSLDELTQTNLDELRAAVRQISQQCSPTLSHDWRGFLQLDFDLSGLPCGKQAIGSKKGYFSGKKTQLVAN